MLNFNIKECNIFKQDLRKICTEAKKAFVDNGNGYWAVYRKDRLDSADAFFKLFTNSLSDKNIDEETASKGRWTLSEENEQLRKELLKNWQDAVYGISKFIKGNSEEGKSLLNEITQTFEYLTDWIGGKYSEVFRKTGNSYEPIENLRGHIFEIYFNFTNTHCSNYQEKFDYLLPVMKTLMESNCHGEVSNPLIRALIRHAQNGEDLDLLKMYVTDREFKYGNEDYDTFPDRCSLRTKEMTELYQLIQDVYTHEPHDQEIVKSILETIKGHIANSIDQIEGKNKPYSYCPHTSGTDGFNKLVKLSLRDQQSYDRLFLPDSFLLLYSEQPDSVNSFFRNSTNKAYSENLTKLENLIALGIAENKEKQDENISLEKTKKIYENIYQNRETIGIENLSEWEEMAKKTEAGVKKHLRKQELYKNALKKYKADDQENNKKNLYDFFKEINELYDKKIEALDNSGSDQNSINLDQVLLEDDLINFKIYIDGQGSPDCIDLLAKAVNNGCTEITYYLSNRIDTSNIDVEPTKVYELMETAIDNRDIETTRILYYMFSGNKLDQDNNDHQFMKNVCRFAVSTQHPALRHTEKSKKSSEKAIDAGRKSYKNCKNDPLLQTSLTNSFEKTAEYVEDPQKQHNKKELDETLTTLEQNEKTAEAGKALAKAALTCGGILAPALLVIAQPIPAAICLTISASILIAHSIFGKTKHGEKKIEDVKNTFQGLKDVSPPKLG